MESPEPVFLFERLYGLLLLVKVHKNEFEIFVNNIVYFATQLWNTFHAKDAVVPALRESLRSLQLDYVDLYLIHWPLGVFVSINLAYNMPLLDVGRFGWWYEKGINILHTVKD